MLVEWEHKYAGGTGTFVKINPTYYKGEKLFLREIIAELGSARASAISELWDMHFNPGRGYVSNKPKECAELLAQIKDAEKAS